MKRFLAVLIAATAIGSLSGAASAQGNPWFQAIPFFHMPPPPPPPPPPGYYPQPAPPPQAYGQPYEGVNQPPVPPKPKIAKPALTCDKAKAIVADFGFTDIEPQTCKGKVYAFGAKRDGKSFSVKLSSTSGELTEVKRL